ncbi:MAG: beta-propeller domain-containing protein [Verrucomicrobiales bacterium]|nr:beta-propeller domain-containing protein [Verrucomicrobiales bacterium]
MKCVGLVDRFVKRALLSVMVGVSVLMAVGSAMGAEGSRPRIASVERRGAETVIKVEVPVGVLKLVLEGCQRDDLKGWIPRAVSRIANGETSVTFRLPSDSRLEMFRVRAETTDPLPASFYAGTTNFPGEPATGPLSGGPGGLTRVDNAVVPGAVEDTTRAVVESDIWVLEGDTLYFFNQYRGLQVVDLTQPDAPALKGTFPMPGAGEQMYVLEGQRVALLAHDPCNQWGTDSESAVVIVDASVNPPVEVARMPLKGRIVESRKVGTALYVATETWQASTDGSGSWQSGTWVASFDLSDPAKPVARGTLWFIGSGNVVTATDKFLFVAVTDYSKSWPWRTDLQVVDIADPKGEMAAFAKIALPGRVADKFKIDVLGDVLRVVVEATESATSARWVTMLETYRLADPRAAGPQSYTALDRLELARGERLFATRFDGTRGYVVTFERVDPLWVIDLSDPSDLKVAGELEIPGWSTYLRPMGDRLLTMGVDDARGSRVAVQLFDVTDAARPKLLSKIPLGENASWSEANQDEKAFGVALDAGLLMVPVSEWSGTGGGQGVQLIDLGRDQLTKRGWLKSEDLVPRRATLHHDRLLAVTGRHLVSADVTDRDQPRISAELELAYPVDRVLLVGNYLLEFVGSTMRLRELGADTGPSASINLGGLPVWGAALRGNRLHLVQGQYAEVGWEYDGEKAEWIGHTNNGTVLVSIWDASQLPNLQKLGETKAESGQTWGVELQPLWLRDGLVVWANAASSYNFGWWGGPVFADAALVRGVGMPGFWAPWWRPSSRELLAVDISRETTPVIVSQTRLEGSGNPAGGVFAASQLVFSSRQRVDSEVIGTNDVIETIWVPGEEIIKTNVVIRPDGSTATEIVKDTSGELRTVTNQYPVLRWWSRYELDVVDYSADAANPVRRPSVTLPGTLQGVGKGGALLYTTATRNPEGKENQQVWLEASAYDGVEVRLVDSVVVADLSSSETQAMIFRDDLAYVARGGWNDAARQRLEVWALSGSGKWVAGADLKLSAAPGELHLYGDMLLARNGSALDLFGLSNPAQPVRLPVLNQPGCFGGDLNRADGDSARGLWMPLGDYGAVRVGP